MDNQHIRIRAIFNACLQESDAIARFAIVDRECRGDEVLRLHVIRLLDAHEANDEFQEGPLIPLKGIATSDVGEKIDNHDTITLPFENDRCVLPAGTKVGSFRVLGLIGEGGMGLVYEAEQEQPIRRKVALKLIKPGMDSREVIVRFQAERQALALMNHPNIACVLDAGTTEAGSPYFVMELVQGLQITEFCDQQRLTLAARLHLFGDVCRAVQHAHQRGIIHRDIKPSNVMVTLHDGRPMVKVIDFGVAKALSRQLTEKTLYTSYGQLIGTPMYMSPEQAEMSGMAVDTRTDIYSLGVLLYRLLTGTTPFDSEIVRAAPLDELRRMIREEEPRRPSAKVSTIRGEVLRTITDQRQLEINRLTPLLRGDLDWIVMKALEKDRNRRYESVGAMIDDLDRYFQNEPILARPPSQIYLLKKFYRRHRLLLLTASLVVLSLITGTALALLQADRAWRAESTANLERDRAQQSQRRMRQMLYAADMRLATDAFLDNDVIRAHEALNRHQPQDGQTDQRSFEWYYLAAKAGVTSQQLFRSDSPQYFCCAIPQTNHIACCGADSIVRVFDADNGKPLATFESGQGEVNGLAVSADGLLLASAGDDGTIRLWDLQNQLQRLRIQAHQGPAFQVAFSSDSQKIVSCGDEPDARLWSVDDGAALGVLESNGIDLETLCINSSDTVSLGGRSGALFVYQLPGSHLVAAIPGIQDDGRTDAISCSGYSSDGRFLADGHLIGILNLRLSESPTHIWKRFVLNDSVQSIAFSPDNQWLAAADRGGAIALFPLELDEFTSTTEFFAAPTRRQMTWNAHDGRIYGLTFTPDSQQIVSSGRDGRIVRWSPMSDNAVHHQCDWTAKVLAFDPQGGIVAIGDTMVRYSRDERRKWNIQKTLDPQIRTGTHARLTVARDSGCICWIRESETCIRAMTDTHQPLGIQWQADDGDRPGMISVSPDGRLLAIEVLPADPRTIGHNPDQSIRCLWLIERESKREIARIPCNTIQDLTFSPDSRFLTLAVSREVLLVDTVTGGVLHRLPGHTITASGQAFSPDGQILATVGDRTMKLWNTENGQPIWSVTAHSIAAKDVEFTPDGRTVMTIGEDSMLRCWRHGACNAWSWRFHWCRVRIRKLEISPDGRTAVVRYRDEKVLMFDTSDRVGSPDSEREATASIR